MVVTVDGVEMLKVDAHTHILPATAWPETPGVKLRCIHEAEGPFAARLEWEDGRLFRKITKSCFDATAVLEECDAHGVDVQVLCTVPVMFNYHLEPEVGKGWARFLNDDMAATVKVNPKRLIGLGTLPLQDPAAAVVELRRCVEELGLRGVQVGSHVDAHCPEEASGKRNMALCAPELRCVWREAERLGCAVLVHPWDMQPWCPGQYWLPWLVGMPSETALAGASFILGGVLDECPGLKVMLSHGGGALPFIIGRLDWGHKCRPDLVAVDTPGKRPRDALKRMYVDSITHDDNALEFLVENMGADRVMLGSDYPFPLGEVPSVAPVTGEVLTAFPGELIQEHPTLPAATKATLLSATALEWLGLDAAEVAASFGVGVGVGAAAPPAPPVVA